jgi:predicted nucleotidyltransferase
MISYSHKCIFIHIPKTAGTSLENVIWPSKRTEANLWMGFIDKFNNKYQTGGLQHLLSRQIRDEVGEKIHKKYYKFCFVRNPWDKAVSQFSYMSKRKSLQKYIGMKPNDSFKKYLALIKRKRHIQWEPQVSFIKDENGESLVDFIGRFENYDKDAKTILAKLNIVNAKIPHDKKSVRTHYAKYYDDESIEMVNEMYAQDIKEFGYKYL